MPRKKEFAQKTSIWLPENIRQEIQARGKFSHIIRRDLERLYTMYRRALKKLALTEAEAKLVANTLSNVTPDYPVLPALPEVVASNISPQEAEMLGVDQERLIQKLRDACSRCEFTALAIMDAVERWNNSGRPDNAGEFFAGDKGQQYRRQ